MVAGKQLVKSRRTCPKSRLNAFGTSQLYGKITVVHSGVLFEWIALQRPTLPQKNATVDFSFEGVNSIVQLVIDFLPTQFTVFQKSADRSLLL